MHHRDHVNQLYSFAFAMLFVKMYMAYVAIGGVDIDVYLIEAWRIDYTNPRYYQEPVSWAIIGGLGTALPYEAFTFGFSITILLLGMLRLGVVGGVLLYIAFLSPFGVMLEFNVLRQCLGAVFLAIFMVELQRRRALAAMAFAGLAALSHNSSILIVAFALFFHFTGRIGVAWRVIAFASLLLIFSVLSIFTNYSPLGGRAESFRPDLADGFENVIYVGFALAFCGLLFWGAQQGKWRSMALGMCVAVVFAVVLAVTMSLGSWVYGRMAITTVVICQFLLFYDTFEVGEVSRRGVVFLVSIAVVNGMLLFFHPGAWSMIV